MQACTFNFQNVSIPISNVLTLSGPGDEIPQVFLHNSKTPQDIEKKLSNFNFTPLTVILRILS